MEFIDAEFDVDVKPWRSNRDSGCLYAIFHKLIKPNFLLHVRDHFRTGSFGLPSMVEHPRS